MNLPKRQLAILLECSKDLSDKSFQNPLDRPDQLRDIQELIKYGYLKLQFLPTKNSTLSMTCKGKLLLEINS